MTFRRAAFVFFFFNDTATTEIYTLSLHDALPISGGMPPVTAGPHLTDQQVQLIKRWIDEGAKWEMHWAYVDPALDELNLLRSEEHTSELQSHLNLVCRLLLEKKKKNNHHILVKNI